MSMDRFETLIYETKMLVKKSLDDSNRPEYLSDKQLMHILKDLDQMNTIRDPNMFLPSYPRWIIDSWDYNDKLGDKLLSLLTVYEKF